MRDPRGVTTLTPTEVVRSMHAPIPPDDFLRSEPARALVAAGRLVAFELPDDCTVVSPRLPFVSHPYEWTDTQFVDAARLTLQVCDAALKVGQELKDASAWNVIFAGCRPVFCDHASFAPITRREWWAFGQFVRHFVLPLCLSQVRGLPARTAFLTAQDGVDPERARGLLGARRFLTRYWPLMTRIKREQVSRPGTHAPPSGTTFHKNLYALSHWLIDGVEGRRHSPGPWMGYTGSRPHYDADSVELKRATVARWLEVVKPRWVLDLGCNTGEYSRLARAAGARVVAVDADHRSVAALYAAAAGDPDIHPIVAELDDLSAGRGWAGEEVPGLLARLAGLPDVVLMLALIHHLAIARSVPLEMVAQLAFRLTNRHVILEFVDSADPMVQSLAAQRDRDAAEFTIKRQRAALAQLFTTVEEVALGRGARVLVLLERR